MHPLIFRSELFTLHTYWIFFALAIMIGTYTLTQLSVKNSLKLSFISNNATTLILWSLVGARISSLIENSHIYFSEISLDSFLRLFAFWDRNLSVWGAAVAFLICLYLICKNQKQDFWKWLDVIIPSLILGLAFNHIGAFFEGINYGHETSLPWGVNFESPAIKYAVPIHPTQIYAAVYSIATVIILTQANHIEKIRNLRKPGFIGILGIVLYNLFRFLEEFLRGDDTLTIFDIRLSQIVVLVVLLTGLGFLYKRYHVVFFKRKRKSKSTG